MKLTHLPVLAILAVAAGVAVPAAGAQSASWLTRCNLALGNPSAPESGKYMYMTPDKVSDPARAAMDYSASISARAAVYPTAAKDLLNPYSSLSLSVGYYGAVGQNAPYATKPAIGHIRVGAMGKDFKVIPGSPVSLKLVIDGVSFGPYQPNPSSLSSGMYSVWLDTAETDGDAKPPILSPADFAKLAKAVDAMKAVEIVLVQDSANIVSAAIPFPQFTTWRDGLAAWASKTKPGVGAATSCPAGGEIMH